MTSVLSVITVMTILIIWSCLRVRGWSFEARCPPGALFCTPDRARSPRPIAGGVAAGRLAPPGKKEYAGRGAIYGRRVFFKRSFKEYMKTLFLSCHILIKYIGDIERIYVSRGNPGSRKGTGVGVGVSERSISFLTPTLGVLVGPKRPLSRPRRASRAPSATPTPSDISHILKRRINE